MTSKDISYINEGLKRFEEIFNEVGRTPSFSSVINFMRGYLGSRDINLNILLNMIESFFRSRGWSLI